MLAFRYSVCTYYVCVCSLYIVVCVFGWRKKKLAVSGHQGDFLHTRKMSRGAVSTSLEQLTQAFQYTL
jgi:hypothetical protein